jgi:hypothetical protein
MQHLGSRHRIGFFLGIVGLASMLGLSGCGGGDPFERQPIQGSVNFEGKPIQFGVIRFEPADKEPTGTSASIRDGRFKIERSAGVGPGNYKVYVQAFDKMDAGPAGAFPGEEGTPPQNILPEKFLNEPAAKITISKVANDKPNEVSLDLK